MLQERLTNMPAILLPADEITKDTDAVNIKLLDAETQRVATLIENSMLQGHYKVKYIASTNKLRQLISDKLEALGYHVVKTTSDIPGEYNLIINWGCR